MSYDGYKALLSAETDNFEELLAIGGIDPTQDFRGADLRGVIVGEADLTGWDFTNADLTGADLSNAKNVEDAIFVGANLDKVIWEQASQAGEKDVVVKVPTATATFRSTQVDTETLQRIYLDLNALCQLQEMVVNNPDAPGRSLAQQHAIMRLSTNPETGEPFTPIAHLLREFAKAPDATFRDLLNFVVKGGDASKLIEDVKKEEG